MKNFLLIITLVSSVAGLSKNNLPEHEGEYLGLGTYISTQGATGTYPSFARISQDLWSLAYVKGDKLFRYDAIVETDDNGFFNTIVIRSTEGKESVFDGFGYCLDNYCHLSTAIDDNAFEETITFLENGRMKRVGSLRYADENGTPQTMRWTEDLMEMQMGFTEELP